MIIYEDKDIRPDTIVDVISNTTKKNILQADVEIENFLAGVFIYVLKNTDNKKETGYAKRIAKEYLKKASKYQSNSLKINEFSAKNEKTCGVNLFNGNLFSPVGAASILANWEEDNSFDKKVIEILTGINYIDYIQELNKSDIDINISGRLVCISESNLAIRDSLIESIHGIHLNLFFECLSEIILGSTLYIYPSRQLLEKTFDFIAFAGNNITKSKRITENDWSNYLCVFGRQIFGNKSEHPISILISKYELFLEGNVKVALHLISEQIDENSLLIRMLQNSSNKSLVYYLSNAIRKAAVLSEHFSIAMLLLLKLSKYNDIFFKNMVYVMNPAYIQTEADFAKRKGIIKNLFRKNSELAWKLTMELVKLGNNESSVRL